MSGHNTHKFIYNHTKTIVLLTFFAFVFFLCLVHNEAVAATPVASGTCGTDATWKLEGSDEDMILTIEGSGPMDNYFLVAGGTRFAPWYDYREKIKQVIVKDGITSIGYMAFYYLENVETISIPNTVTSIGKTAFGYCSKLKSIVIPYGVEEIPYECFYMCTSLSRVCLPESITTISTRALETCESLEYIYIPSSVTLIANCTIPKSTLIVAIRGSAADNYVQTYGNSVVYVDDDQNGINLNFTTTSIIMSPETTVNLSDYLASDVDLSKCNVKLSNTNNFAYDDGKVVNLGVGECNITVTYGEFSATTKLVATDSIPHIESIEFSQEKIVIAKGHESANAVSVAPVPATVDDLIWTSSDESVAYVSNGIVSAVGFGEAVITASSSFDNSISNSYIVTVNQPLRDLYVHELPSIEVGSTAQIEVVKIPQDTTDDISFSTSNDKIAVDNNGVITAIKVGDAKVIVSCGNVSKEISINIIRKPYSISLNKKTIQLEATKTVQLEVIFDPEDTTERDVVWTSSKESVATVDENGLVTALGKGITTITATVGNLTAECTVVCPEVNLEEITIEESHEMLLGDNFRLEVTYVPETTTDDKSVEWTSSDESVANVSSNGEVNAVSAGNAIITAKVGACTATCNITVKKLDPDYEIPSDRKGYCKQQLSEISLPESFSWENPDAIIGSEGTSYYLACYTPEDTDMYNIIHDIEIPIQITHCEWSVDEAGHWKNCACGYKEPKADHTFGDWETTLEPTSIKDGEKKRVCTVCGYEETATIDSVYISISTASQLDEIRNNSRAHYVLENDIDLTQETSNGGDFYNNGKGWKPISNFSGVFDGNGHKIYGLTIGKYSEYTGLFGRNNGTIKNLTVEGKISNDYTYVGGIAGYNSGNIVSCVNKCNITSQGPNVHYTGGIAACNEGTISDCKNYGDITNWGIMLSSSTSGPSVTTGGLAGSNKGEVSGENHGDIKSITPESFGYAGGITGNNSAGSKIGNSTNKGTVMCNVLGDKTIYTAIAGGISADTKGAITDSNNNGSISANGGKGSAYAGGISGRADGCNLEICGNYGTVNATNEGNTATFTYAGGIVGYDSNGTNYRIYGSVNEGSIASISSSGNSIAGGISGYNSTKIDYCGNTGLVAASREDTGSAVSISGGIAGMLTDNGDVTCSANYGVVFTDGVGYAGGISGTVAEGTSVSQNYNVGDILGFYTSGGIAGMCSGLVEDCYSINQFDVSKTKLLGGIVGHCTDTGSVKNVYSVISYTGSCNNAGLLIGYNQGTSAGSLVASHYNELNTVSKGSSIGTILCVNAMEQQENYAHFDLADTWDMGTGKYKLPVLKNCVGTDAQNNNNINVGNTCIYTNWEVLVMPTCTNSGSKEGTCSTCGEKHKESVAALGHKWNSTYTIDKNATQTTKGSKSIHCSVCNAVKPGSAVAIAKLAPPEIVDLKTVKISKLIAAKKAVTVKWKKISKKDQKKIQGIEIQVSNDKNFKNIVKKTTAKKSKTSNKVKGLKSKKKYWVRIRAYKNAADGKHVSAWKTKSVKIK